MTKNLTKIKTENTKKLILYMKTYYNSIYKYY